MMQVKVLENGDVERRLTSEQGSPGGFIRRCDRITATTRHQYVENQTEKRTRRRGAGGRYRGLDRTEDADRPAVVPGGLRRWKEVARLARRGRDTRRRRRAGARGRAVPMSPG